MTQVSKRDIIEAATGMLDDVTSGALRPGDVEDRAVAVVREQVGQVNGPGDALWGLHVDICRQVLEAGGISGDELAEWTAVARRREGLPGT